MCGFYRAVLGELQLLRDDARPKNNNCKLKEKTGPSISLVTFTISVPLAGRGVALTTEAKQLEGSNQPVQSELSEAAHFNRHECLFG